MSFNLDIPTDFMSNLMTEPEEMILEMLNEASPILVKSLEAECGKHYVSGDLQGSIKAFEAKKAKNGAYITEVTAVGTDSKGVRNNEKLAYLEYGTYKQTAKPVLNNASATAEGSVLQKMQSVYDSKVGGD